MENQDDYREFIRLFNAGRYHESHQALQDVWRTNPSNAFYKGLIQLAGALDHWEDKSFYWAESLFRSSAELLRRYSPAHEGLDLAKLLPVIENCADVAEQQRKDKTQALRLPEITLDLGDGR